MEAENREMHVDAGTSGMAKVGNGCAQAQPIMSGAQPIPMFTISIHTYTCI